MPNERRDQSRLLIVDRVSERIEHGLFADLGGLIDPGDALVINTTSVVRARLLGRRDSGAAAEVLLLRPTGKERQYEAMVHPGGKLKPGRRVHVAAGLDVVIDAVTDRRTRLVTLDTTIDVDEAIDRYGHVPLPPYIARGDVPADSDRYQTVYAKQRGSVAAPTAGLHFTPELLATLDARGVRLVEILLHVGAGTFKPVEVDDPADHVMHEEQFDVTEGSTHQLNAARAKGKKIWAVGSTSARTLESSIDDDGVFQARRGETRLFIRPPYAWRAVDRLVTNFHLPRSTLLMLVAAFAGYELTMEAYRIALASGYRFYSYGDAMVIL